MFATSVIFQVNCQRPSTSEFYREHHQNQRTSCQVCKIFFCTECGGGGEFILILVWEMRNIDQTNQAEPSLSHVTSLLLPGAQHHTLAPRSWPGLAYLINHQKYYEQFDILNTQKYFHILLLNFTLTFSEGYNFYKFNVVITVLRQDHSKSAKKKIMSHIF